MKSHQLLSEKDLQVLKVTYRQLIDNYYENPSEENVDQIILLNSITMQTISTREQSDSLLLISMLEILKLKTKSTSKELFESVQSTIIHLKNPLKIFVKNEIIQNGLERVELYTLCCLVISRFYEHEMKPKVDSYDWDSFIQKISKNCDKNMAIAVEVLVILVADFMMFGKEVNNSGMVKYICSVYLPQTLADKINLYRALKLLKLVSINDKSILPSREKNIGLVIYTHPAYIIIIQQISELCFEQEYSKKVLDNAKDIDAVFVWSYNSKFCELAHQKTIDDLERMLVEGGKDISVDLEYKIYMTISNLIRGCDLKLNQSWKIPNRHENLNVYLRLVNSMIEKNAPEQYKKINMKGIEAAYEKRKITDPVTDKLIKDIKNLDPSSSKKVGKLDFSYLQQFSIDKNTDILMEKAGKIPRNNEELQITEEILNINKKNADEFELDIISSLKSKAIESLRKSILNYNIDLPIIFNNLKPENYDVDVINKLIKLGELYVVKNPESGTKFNAKKFIDILDWLENNYGIAIIDWVAAGEILTTIFGPDEWQRHMGEIPNRNFWLLNSYDADSNTQILSQIANVPLTHPKLPLILGFISKSSNESLKSSLLKTKMLQEILTKILSFENSRAATKSIREEDLTDGNEMNHYLINVLNMSSYIFEWSKGEDSKEIKSRIVEPCLENVIRCFHGEQHELKFIENCLPHEVGVLDLKDLNMGRLLETHGKLCSYLDKNGYENKIDLRKIGNIGLESDPEILEQILVFLEDNPNLIDKKDLTFLLEQLLNSQKNGNKYWKYFPHYMSIINHIIKIVTNSKNSEVINNLTDILEMIIGGTADNPNIIEFGEHDEFYENILLGLDGVLERKIRIDAKRLIREAEKINDPEWNTKMISKLKEIDASIAKWPTKPETKQQTPQNPTKVSSIPQSLNLHSVSTPVVDNYPESSPNVNIEEKKDEIMFKEGDTNDYLQSEEGSCPSMSAQDKELLDALKMLKKIIKKEEPKETFPKLVDIFMASDLNRNQRYILGQLLTEYYEIVEKNPKIIDMLQLKDKTNLNREICFNFLTKLEEVFVISKRWKLSGYDFLDLAMQRVQCTNKNKIDCVENGCEIAEYNLQDTKDTTYFYNKKYHEIVLNILNNISEGEEFMYYLILVGSSAKLLEIKTYYTDNQLHTKLIESLKKEQYFKDHRIMANFSYALSSLIFTQSHISTDVVSKKEGMLKIFNGMRTFVDSKSVVEAGCSLLSNLCFSNKESKEMLHSYGISELLLFIFNKCLEHPEVSTYKQILRTMGNISLHKGCAESLIDGHICSLVIKLIVEMKVVLYKDDEKTKLLKLCIDVISNLTSQKYKLLEMHNEKITNIIIELLNDKGNVDDNILMSAIDTIDGLCQNQDVESYVVMDKKLLLRLIDLLKVKEDEKLITKIIRLLTNITLNERCTPEILQGGLLGVLANAVLPVIRNEKIDLYVKKIVVRIFNHKADIKLILKGGYLDCLLQAIESGHEVDEQYVNILVQYSMYIPNYLNNRTFFCLLRMMVNMQNNKEVLDKCLKLIKTIVGSEEKSVGDVEIEGCVEMYDKLYHNEQIGKANVLYLMALHCTKSKLMKKQMLALNKENKSTLLDNLSKLNPEDESIKSLVLSVIFSIVNKNRTLIEIGEELVKEEGEAFKMLSKGFPCKLYRVDGSSKNAIIDTNEMYNLRAYKAPDGEVKEKYVIGVKQLRDWQFSYELADDAWKSSVFVKDKTVFGDKAKMSNCVTLLGSKEWGGFIFINIEFVDSEVKVKFIRALSALICAFKI